MNVTFFTAFIAYYIASWTVLNVSGIIALVTYGIGVGKVVNLLHDNNATHALHNCWSFLLYVAETIIFLIELSLSL